LASITTFLVEGEITNIFWRRKMQKRISELKQHYVVCGLGDTGRHAVEELQKTRTPYVVIETHEESVQRLRESEEEFKDLPNRIGGLRLASEVLRPHVVGFLDTMLKEQSRTLRIEEIEISSGSPWIGRSLGELSLRHTFNLLPMAVKSARSPEKSEFQVNPPD